MAKTMAKTKKTSAKQMKKGWGLHFSVMLNLQHISEIFLTFCRVRGEKGENEAKKYSKNPSKIEKNNDIWTKQWENTHKTNGKRLGMGFLSSTQQHSAALSSTQQHSAALSSAQSATNFQVFLTFCRPKVKIEKESKK